jgi:hypothetical protein
VQSTIIRNNAVEIVAILWALPLSSPINFTGTVIMGPAYSTHLGLSLTSSCSHALDAAALKLFLSALRAAFCFYTCYLYL